MYCSECGKYNLDDSQFCQDCGIRIANTPTDIKSEHKKPFTEFNGNVSPYVISTGKLFTLSVVTCNIYYLYWFYKQWDSFKNERHLNVTPWVRTLFAPLYAYSLFREIDKSIRTLDKSRHLDSGLLAVVFFILVFLYRLPEPYIWISLLFSSLPLIPVQKAINYYWIEKYGRSVKISKFGFWNWFFVAIFGLLIVAGFIEALPKNNNIDQDSYTSASSDYDNQKINSNSINFNQEKIASSVVNILCPSTFKNEETTGGSGTILSEDGIILTNSHIIPQDKKNIHVDEVGCMVVLPDSQTGQASEFYLAHPIVIPDLSDKYDLAYMQIYASYYDPSTQKYSGIYPRKFPTFKDTAVCTNESPKLGEAVRIFGYPAISGGYSLTITDGVVSSFPGDGLIVTSAKISHGNSGGLAVDKNGCMIGVPSMVSSDESESLGVIYSMDLVNKFSNEVSSYLDTLK